MLVTSAFLFHFFDSGHDPGDKKRIGLNFTFGSRQISTLQLTLSKPQCVILIYQQEYSKLQLPVRQPQFK